MKFTGPDSAVLAWFRSEQDASSVKSQSIGQAGRAYADRCTNPRCRRIGTRTTTYPRGEPTPRCAACGALWTWTEALIPAGVFSSGRSVSPPPAGLERAASLAPVIARLRQTAELETGQGDLYVAWLCVGSKTIDQVAADATARAFHGKKWERRDVRRAISRARKWLELALDRRGLLERV